MNGYKATQEIRHLSDKDKACIPIIAITANAFEEDKEKAFNAGMNGYLTKPIQIEMMLETIDSILTKNSYGTKGGST